jgi:hypothetical protein
MRLRLIVGFALATAGLAAGPASAEPVLDRVQVGGVPGVSATRSFPTSLAVTLAVPSGYGRGCCYDFRSGQWTGPAWRASGNPSVGEASTIDWRVDFVRGKTLQGAAKAAWTQFPQASAAKRKVRHVVDGRTVGTLAGYAVVDTQRSPGAEVQAVLAVDLGKKVTALLKFDMSDPPVDQDASFGALTVNGMAASKWNRKQADTAFASAYIEGLLPPARIKARASGRQIKGTVTDQFGGPESTIPVVLKKGGKKVATATTNTRGGFTLTAPKAGSYQVVATLGGSSANARISVR